ncbi:GNAT family N-acetyltransferase [soil metagenome]
MIRLAAEDDLPAINAIYNHYVINTTSTAQYEAETDADRLAWFRVRGPKHPVTVYVDGDEVVGWASLSTYNKRAGYHRTVESSVYLRHDQHRRGIGRALMQDIMARATALGHHAVVASISGDQAPSIGLHESLGFEKMGHLREIHRKFDRVLDVVYYVWLIPE